MSDNDIEMVLVFKITIMMRSLIGNILEMVREFNEWKFPSENNSTSKNYLKLFLEKNSFFRMLP